tara:strand:- start:23 stop:628 length:606 start_codon:yes stop_codon:yes gene_type:complete
MYYKGIIVLIVIAVLMTMENSIADVTTDSSQSTQTNTSGSNTSISGSYESESTTTYQSGSSSNTTTNNDTTNNSNQKTAVNSATAPSMQVYGQDSCVVSTSTGVTVIGFSFSGGSYHEDKNCERRKGAVLLSKLGMKVAAISLMCQDENVFDAMWNAGTPCPFEGLIGQKAKEKWMEKRRKELTGGTQAKPSMTWNNMLEE